jgi:phytoene dehydrogenase-like protein
MGTPRLDAIVVGSGPNGLAAAIELGRAGRSVHVIEAAETLGGGLRTQELTLPGYLHDVCATVVPLAIGSPFFRTIDFAAHGVSWVHPEVALAHLLTPERAVLLHQDLEATARGLGRDGAAWRRWLGPVARDWDVLATAILGPVVRFPRHPFRMARFGLPSLLSATAYARLAFRTPEARALYAGIAAHAEVRLGSPLTAGFGIVLALLAHAVGWPLARGGSERIAGALVAEARSLGVTFETGHRVTSLDGLPEARAVVLDLTPRQVVAVAGGRLPGDYRRALERFRYGPGVFKLDWALDGPVPWRDPAAAGAGTVHIGGTLRAIAAAEDAVADGRHPPDPFILFVQPTVADPSRAPAGGHVAWAYCHVPNGSTADMTEVIEGRIEAHAPGFRDRILARAAKGPAAMEAWDANYVGGDINGGLQDWRQLVFRPVARWDPYATPVEGLFLCSSSTAPGGGVHGMSGRNAARSVLRRIG